MTLLPPRPDVCQECASDHLPDEAHNQTSLYYQYAFRGKHGRWPKWSDAIAHLEPALRAVWEQELRAEGVWDD